MGKLWANMGSFMGNFLTTNNFTELFVCQPIVEAYRAVLLYAFRSQTPVIASLDLMETILPLDSLP